MLKAVLINSFVNGSNENYKSPERYCIMWWTHRNISNQSVNYFWSFSCFSSYGCNFTAEKKKTAKKVWQIQCHLSSTERQTDLGPKYTPERMWTLRTHSSFWSPLGGYIPHMCRHIVWLAACTHVYADTKNWSKCMHTLMTKCASCWPSCTQKV